jgi:PhzF family phenazine biosynthesis protein
VKINVKIINAFSVGNKGGNPAGVVFDAGQFSNEQKQKIAQLAGFPETAFVSPSEIADYKLDFFTPIKQIAHCGHATIATFSYLKKQGEIAGNISSKETIDGTRRIEFRNNLAFMEQRGPVFEKVDDKIFEILKSLQIDQHSLAKDRTPVIVDTGNKFLIVPIKDIDTLKNIQYDVELVTNISKEFGLIGYYLYSSFDITPGMDATTRMFAPFYGIEEEAGTGMAAGPLASYLYATDGKQKTSYNIEQGRYMKNPSVSQIQVFLETQDGKIDRLFAGGDSYVSGEKIIEI